VRSFGMSTPTHQLPGLVVPRSTYRVQFQAGCSFEDVARAVPYLAALGISHLYSSPYLRARAGSTHGYDIVDHASLNPELGSEQQHQVLCRTLREHGMGQILDIVPNHMGVLEADNPWWLDVLEHGRASPHAQAFDIEWQPADPAMAGRLLLPVLGDHRGRVLEAGEIALRFDPQAGSFSLHYYAHRFPIDPSHYAEILRAAPLPAPPDVAAERASARTGQGAVDDAADNAAETAAAMLDAFDRLPSRDAPDAEAQRARRGDSALLQRRLGEFAREVPAAAAWIAAALARFEGKPGEP
jgi:(1->4)-alpha-D-glucan 1-alpha-D-glucosylmutase